MTDGIAWIGRSPDLSRPVEPSALGRVAEAQGGEDKGGFAALMDRSSGRDTPPRGASEPQGASEPNTEAAADEAGSPAEDVGFEDGSVPPASLAPIPWQEPPLDAGEGVSASAGMEWAEGPATEDVPATEDAGAPDPLRGPKDPEAATGMGNAAAPEAGWPGFGQGVALHSATSDPDVPGSRTEKATESARRADTGPEESPAVMSRHSRAAAGPVQGVAASLLSGLVRQEAPGASAERRAWPAAAGRVADSRGQGGGATAWTPLAPVFAAASLAREGSAFGATASWSSPAGAAPVAAPTGLAAGALVPAEGRSRGAGPAALKGEGGPARKLMGARPEPDKEAGDRPHEATTSLGKPAARADIDQAGPPEAAKMASPLATGHRSREGRRLVGAGEGGLDAPPVSPPPGVGLAAPLDGPGVPPDARRILQQVAAHPVLRTGGSAELSLSPEELGPLRLSVEMDEAGLRILIEAARPETADLMRRHVEALRQELRQEGLGSVGVSIGGGEGRSGRDSSPDRGQGDGWPAPPRGAVAGAEPVAPAAPRTRTANAAGHIDLRF